MSTVHGQSHEPSSVQRIADSSAEQHLINVKSIIHPYPTNMIDVESPSHTPVNYQTHDDELHDDELEELQAASLLAMDVGEARRVHHLEAGSAETQGRSVHSTPTASSAHDRASLPNDTRGDALATPQTQHLVIQSTHVPFTTPQAQIDRSLDHLDSRSMNSTENRRRATNSRSLWRERESRLLIAAAISRLDDLKSTSHNKSQVFSIISDHLRQHGYERSGDQCRWRWRNLKNEYRRQRAYRIAEASGELYNGTDIIETWPFYEDMAYVLGDSPLVPPTIDSTASTATASSITRALQAATSGTSDAGMTDRDTDPELANLMQFFEAPTSADTPTATGNALLGGTTPSAADTASSAVLGRPAESMDMLTVGPRRAKRQRVKVNDDVEEQDAAEEELAASQQEWLRQERTREQSLVELKDRLDRILVATERNAVAAERSAVALERLVMLGREHSLHILLGTESLPDTQRASDRAQREDMAHPSLVENTKEHVDSTASDLP